MMKCPPWALSLDAITGRQRFSIWLAKIGSQRLLQLFYRWLRKFGAVDFIAGHVEWRAGTVNGADDAREAFPPRTCGPRLHGDGCARAAGRSPFDHFAIFHFCDELNATPAVDDIATLLQLHPLHRRA